MSTLPAEKKATKPTPSPQKTQQQKENKTPQSFKKDNSVPVVPIRFQIVNNKNYSKSQEVTFEYHM